MATELPSAASSFCCWLQTRRHRANVSRSKRWNVSGCQWRMQGADLRLTQQLIEGHLANLFGYVCLPIRPSPFLPPQERLGRRARKCAGRLRTEEGCESIKPIHLRRPAFPKDPHDFLVALREGSD